MGIYPQKKKIKLWQLGSPMAELNEIFLKEVGKRIRQLRESQNLTLDDMDFHTGIDSSDFNKIEQGKTNITLRTLIRVSKGLNVQPKELLNFEYKFNYESFNIS